MRAVLQIVERKLAAAHNVKQPRTELLVAAVKHLVIENAAALGAIDRPQDEDVDLVLHHAARIARRLVEIDDA